MTPLFLGSLLDRFLGPKLFIAAILIYGAWRIRTVKKVFGGIVASVGFVGTIGAAILVSYGLALGLGWVDVYPGEIGGDLEAAAGAAWDYGLDLVFNETVEFIKGAINGG